MKRLTMFLTLAMMAAQVLGVDCDSTTTLSDGSAGSPACASGGALTSLLMGSTLCGTRVTGSDRWQEYHASPINSAGNLTEYAKGPSDPVDPTHVAGKWWITGAKCGIINYLYLGDPTTYQFRIYPSPTPGAYQICDTTPTPVANATFQSGLTACGF